MKENKLYMVGETINV